MPMRTFSIPAGSKLNAVAGEDKSQAKSREFGAAQASF